MRQARYNAVAASVHGKIYVFGGMYDLNQTQLHTVECFDPLSNTWQTMSPMPVPLDWGHSIVTFGGSRCYIIGINLTKHRDQTDKLTPPGEYLELSCFDVSTNLWETLPSPSLRAKWSCESFPSIATFRGSVLGCSVQSAGLYTHRWL